MSIALSVARILGKTKKITAVIPLLGKPKSQINVKLKQIA
jgi:hypothetical protein